MTVSGKSVKITTPVTIDPNFFLPPNVVDMRYANQEDASDSVTTRSPDTGEIVSVDYDVIDYSDTGETDATDEEPVNTLLSPPDYVTVVSQQVRVTSDGRFVVDVILDVEDINGVVQYDVRLTKP